MSDLNPPKVPKPDDLRTRIAKVLYERDMVDKFSWAPAWEYAEPHIRQMWLDDADAVIRELGLREEFGALDADDSGALYDSRNEIKLCRGESIKRRYITDWEPDG